jgi:hypothetical protein
MKILKSYKPASQKTATDTLNQLKSSIGAVSVITPSTIAQTIFAANNDRRGFFLFNDTNKDAFIKLAASPTTSSFSFKIGPGGFYERELTNYLGIVTAIWGSAAIGSLYATELT